MRGGVRVSPIAQPSPNRGSTVKYPKLAAAIDDVLAQLTEKYGEPMLEMLIEGAMVKEAAPLELKKTEIPVTKEESG